MREPNLPEFGSLTGDNCTKGDGIQYLNAVMAKYGPPCNFCQHYDGYCEKGYRPRKYALRIGPYDEWVIRRKCPDHEGTDKTEEMNEAQNEKTNAVLDCNYQQYCHG